MLAHLRDCRRRPTTLRAAALSLLLVGPANTLAAQALQFSYDGRGNTTSVLDANADPNNCGSVGNACVSLPNAPAACQAGVCGVLSNGSFIDILDDPMNCGAMGNICQDVDGGSASCSRGQCASVCDYSRIPWEGRCLDILHDPLNCGVPAHQCNKGGRAGTCNDGACDYSGTPEVFSIAGQTAPSVATVSAWAGLTIEGASLDSVFWLSLAESGPTRDGAGNPLAPSPTGYFLQDLAFQATESQIIVPPSALSDALQAAATMLDNDSDLGAHWYRITLYYHKQDSTSDSITPDVALTFSQDVHPANPSPQIASVSPTLTVVADGFYIPDNGCITNWLSVPIGALPFQPVAVLGWDPLSTEFPISKIDDTCIYIRAGLPPTAVGGPSTSGTEIGIVTFVGPATSAPLTLPITTSDSWLTEELGTAPEPAHPSGLILRGAGLDSDGSLQAAMPPGSLLAVDLKSAWFAGDRAVVRTISSAEHPSAFIGYLSATGEAWTPSPITFDTVPVISGISPGDYMRYGTPLIVEGHFLSTVTGVTLTSPDATESLQESMGDGSGFTRLDDEHLRIIFPLSGPVERTLMQSCSIAGPVTETSPGQRVIYVSNNVGAASVSLAAIDPSAPPSDAPALTCTKVTPEPWTTSQSAGGAAGSSGGGGNHTVPILRPTPVKGTWNSSAAGSQGDLTNTVCISGPDHCY